MKLIDQLAAPIEHWVNITLTYRDKEVKPVEAARDLKALADRMRRRFPAVAWLWAIEPQKRGTPHFHIIAYAPAGHDLKAGGVLHITMMTLWNQIAGNGDEEHRWFHLDKAERHRDDATQVDAWEKIQSWESLQKYVNKYIAKDDPAWEGTRTWGVHNRNALPVTIDVDDLTDSQMVEVTRSLRRFYEHQPTGAASVTLLDARGKPWQKLTRRRGLHTYVGCGEHAGPHGWCIPEHFNQLMTRDAGPKIVRKYRRKWRRAAGMSRTIYVSAPTVYRMMAAAIRKRPALTTDIESEERRALTSAGYFFDARGDEQREERFRHRIWTTVVQHMARGRQADKDAAAERQRQRIAMVKEFGELFVEPERPQPIDPRTKPVPVTPPALRDLPGQLPPLTRSASGSNHPVENNPPDVGPSVRPVCKPGDDLPVISRQGPIAASEMTRQQSQSRDGAEVADVVSG